MGVWAGGPDPTKIDIAGIAEAMRPTLAMWMNSHIKVWDIGRYLEPDETYNPETDTGGTRPRVLVLDSGENGAIVQPLRSPSRIDIGGQPNALLGIRFQITRDATVETGQELRGGLLIEVVDGGESKDMAGHAFALVKPVDSSFEWHRIYEAVLVTGGS